MGNRYCENQGFVIGNSLGMQCHVEMTEELVKSWCETGADEIAQSGGPAVQSPQRMQQGMQEKLAALGGVANRLYDHWVKGLKA